MPKDVDDWARIDSARSSVGKGKVRLDGREDSKLYYQERVAVIWIEKVKAMGPCTLVRATLLFGSQRAMSVCLRYPIPVGHCQ